jgi:hypothetical protein
MKFVIRQSQYHSAKTDEGKATGPQYLIVNATTHEIASGGRVAGQLQISMAGAKKSDFRVGKVIQLRVS